jgi:hypothetical protein
MATQEASKSVENYFPKAPIDIKINDLAQEPTPLRIIKFQKYIQQCAINIPIKGNTLGLLGAIINDTDYKSVNNNVSWTPPPTPGATPTMPPPSTTTATTASTRSATEDAAAAAASAATTETNRILQFQQATRDHEKLINTWTHYQGAITALRNLIINNIDEDYIAKHNNALTGFRLVTPAELLNHIKVNYGEVEPRQLKDNEIALDAPWDPSTPIVTLYKRIEDCKLFAEAGEEPLPDKKILRAALLAIESTGLYNLACDNWSEKPSTTKTWPNFKLFFTKESKKVKHHTTGSLGMQDATANALLQLNDAFVQQQQQIQQLSNDRQPLGELPINNNDNIDNSNDHTINNITDQSSELKALKEQVQALMATISNDSNNNNQNNRRNNNTGNSYNNNNNNKENQTSSKSRRATKSADVRAQGYDKDGYAITYCHTHGTSRNLTHTSCTCKYPGDVHKKLATLSNKMGGSSNINQKAAPT